MTRLARTFEALRARQGKALVAYLTAGDPDWDTSLQACRAALSAGADILEIGIPFSDPVADGPVIQRAMERALAGDGGLDPALELVRALRRDHDQPLVLFGYANPLLWGGFAANCERVAQAGGDALLVVDVPPEESEPMRSTAAEYGLDWVVLVAPTSGEERARAIARTASGFLYVVSMAGVTGGDLSAAALEPLQPVVRAVRDVSTTPTCIGFGVRDRQTARLAAAAADGVVVGSAIVRALEQGMEAGDGPQRVAAIVETLRAGADEAK